jgi:hypothetical protein
MVSTDIDLDYQVSLSQDTKYIIIRVVKPMTNELGRRCGADAVELGITAGIKYYLFDLRGAHNVETSITNYQFAYREMGEFSFPKNSRSALLTDPDDRSHDFMETVFRNAGYMVKLFTDEASAIAWLGS